MTVKREIVKAMPKHARELAKHIRKTDRAEVEALGLTPLQVAKRGVEHGHHVFLANGKVVAMFGCDPDPKWAGVAWPWLLSTDKIEGNHYWFALASRKLINHWLEHYDLLTNYVDSRYTDAIRWLQWCGADIRPPEPLGPEGIPFHRFEIYKR